MLVLTRRDGQAIQIGDDIVVRILAISGRWIRVGVEAPESTKILRLELVDRASEKAAGKTLGEAA